MGKDSDYLYHINVEQWCNYANICLFYMKIIQHNRGLTVLLTHGFIVLTHCSLGYFNEILDEYFSSQLQWLMAEVPAVKLPSEESH